MMISFLRRHQKSFFIATIATFLIGTFVGLGGYLFTSRDMSATVASVGSTKIPYSLFMARVNQYADAMREKGSDVTDDALKQIKQGMLRDMIVDELLSQKAGDLGIVVTDAELARDIQSSPAFQRGGAFSPEAYAYVLRTVYRQTPDVYEGYRRQQVKALKFKQLVFEASKIAPPELKTAYAAAHKGSLKDFDKESTSFSQQLRQHRALELLNYYLHQVGSQVEIRTYLDQRESGA
jgi:outer membrane protein assembly factor BamE (lipoprotein component of BamABCDE complex)